MIFEVFLDYIKFNNFLINSAKIFLFKSQSILAFEVFKKKFYFTIKYKQYLLYKNYL
jgi:hypothetical protein